MALLERVSQLKAQGLSGDQIIQALRDEGANPRQINEAMGQSEVKSVVSDDPAAGKGEEGMEGMEPSIMGAAPATTTPPAPAAAPPPAIPTPPAQAPLPVAPAPAAPTAPEAYPAEAYPPETYPPEGAPAGAPPEAYPAEGYPQEGYPEEAYPPETYYQQALDIETVRDVAKQVTDESLSQIKTQLADIAKLKTDIKFQVQNMENRLKKIETVISDLQSAILKKIGEYGEAISDISKEMEATQETFTKMVGPLMDKKRGTTKKATEMTSKKAAGEKPQPSKGGRGASFEEYFR